MAMTAAHRKYREKNPAHKKSEDEKRLDLIISAEAMAALTMKCKAAGITRRQLLEAMALSPFDYHTGVMMMPEITPGLLEEPSSGISIAAVSPEETDESITPVLEEPTVTDGGIESRILQMIEGGLTKENSSPIRKQIVTEIYGGSHQEAAKQIRSFATKHKGTAAGDNLKLLANRIDGSRPKNTIKQQTGKKIDIAASTVAKVKFGKGLKSAVNR